MHKTTFLKRSIVALFACFALANSQVSAAEDGNKGIPWAKVGGWQILVDTTLAGCYMFASWTQGEVVRIGINNDERKKGYLVIGNPMWRSLQDGNHYRLKFQFD